MLRRSKGSGQGRARRSSGSQTNKIALALAFLLVPWAQTAAAADTPGVINHRHDPDRSSSPDAAQRHQVHHQNQPRHRGNSAYAIDDEDRDIPHVAWTEPGDDAARDTPYIVHQKNQPPSSRRPQHVADRVPRNDPTDNHPISKNNINIKNRKLNPPNDASALATLAPAQSVRAPNTPRHLRPRNVDGSGLSSPQVARSLEDWEVEDFVLLATVDGDLFASDRRTGAELWRLEVDQPMIETKHYRANSSILDEDYQPIDHYIWAVEPNRDGGLYVMIPDAGAGLMKTSFTMKRLVEELSPFADEDPPVVYTGDKKTTLITLDAATGRVLKWFGSSGSHINQAESCLRPDTLYNMDSTECSSTGTITLGRTEYTVGIQRRDGRPIATLKYAEWGPNNYDKDLYHQYHTSLDNRYITSQHDGKVYAFDYNHAQSPSTPKFRQKFPAPVARVFDVCRPWDAPSDSNPELVVLPQPPMPSHDADIARMRSNSIFLNQTESGSWYAMSGRVYPLIVDAPMAKISRDDWLDFAYQGIGASASKTLIGTHFLEAFSGGASQPATLPAGSVDRGVDDFDNNDSYLHELLPAEPQDVGFLDRVKLLPQSAANSIIDFISNPTLILIFVIFLIYNGNKLRRSYQHFRAKDFFQFLLESKAKADFGTPPKTEVEERVEIEPHDYPTVAADGPGGVAADVRQGNDNDTAPANAVSGIPQPQVFPDSQPLPDTANEAVPAADAQGAPGEKKKKAHRGRRGGVKHRKGKDKDKDKPASQDDANSGPTVDEIIATPGQGIEVLPKDTAPVVPPIPSSVAQAAGGAILTMGNIEVDLKTQLGSGSNGTLVFAGKFDGRDVAVKRMLIHFYDIASQETRLLRESDDHPNVIRYYSQQSKDGFLYIALERCAASLAEVVEKPSSFPTLAEAGKKDLPAVLYQITNGIHHLHSLRIVHRDLKPQNILVNMGKDGKPRLVVSDFGLCKKLEDTQSSFGATTGRAAGTSGWRAPELLVDDGSDGPLQGVLDTDTTNSGSGSVLVNDALGPGVRRATRAIDIFSLGLVFFYVLTNGFHPFDCGDRYMREVNIRNGKFSLAPLDALGNYAFEAKDLIASMLRRNPKDRPHTLEIMSHPFFWSPKKRLAFLCDVSDHFEKECRDPPSPALQELEKNAPNVAGTDFLRSLPREFIDSMGKQRKYTGSRLLDLLRALRNKRNHYEDMSDSLKRQVGPLPEGYLNFWTCRFPMLLLVCWNVVYEVRWEDTDRFREYYSPAGL